MDKDERERLESQLEDARLELSDYESLAASLEDEIESCDPYDEDLPRLRREYDEARAWEKDLSSQVSWFEDKLGGTK